MSYAAARRQRSGRAIALLGGSGPDTTVAAVSVSPATASVDVDATTALTATATNAAGDTVAGATIAWSSDDETVATVDTDGTVTGVAEGTATITATSNGHSDTCDVTVSAVTGDVTVYTSNFDTATEDQELSLFDSDWVGSRNDLIVRAATDRVEPTSGAGDCGPYGWRGTGSPTGDQSVQFTGRFSSGAFFTNSAILFLNDDATEWYEPYMLENGTVGVSCETNGGVGERDVGGTAASGVQDDTDYVFLCTGRITADSVDFEIFVDGVSKLQVSDTSVSRLTAGGVPGVLSFSNGADDNSLKSIVIKKLGAA